ncbi:hypothetical protein [Euzebya rosea]|uniref:hypothetical protein n=1 Tax=Euzebya rosea TaxID=2052804 RepID=UPI001300308A|nr:hypothetical protein [Euzebya rosea]
MSRMLAVLIAATLALTGCIGGPDTTEAVAAATTYVQALAAADYDTMASVSTGSANDAARYGQQVLLADPEAFSSRDLVVLEPLMVPDQGDGTVLDGELELSTKGISGAPLRIDTITMLATADGWKVDGYDRDGRNTAELFHNVTTGPHQLAFDGVDVASIHATVLLTDAAEDVVLLPISVTAGPQAVTIVPERSTFTLGGRRIPVSDVIGSASVEPLREQVVVLVARQAPATTAGDGDAVGIGVETDGVDVGPLEFELRPQPSSR